MRAAPLGLVAILSVVSCTSSPARSPGHRGAGGGGFPVAGSGGAEGSAGTGGGGNGGTAEGGSGGCTDPAPSPLVPDGSHCAGTQRSGRTQDCGCVTGVCVGGVWTCPASYPIDRCPSQAECDVDSGGYGVCPARQPGGSKRGVGACCTADPANDDCAAGLLCLRGYCTTFCETDDDCGELATPTPFAEGSELHCANVGNHRFCMPGSGRDCTGPGDCGEGEICTYLEASAGSCHAGTRCLAAIAVEGAGDPGAGCTPDPSGASYACRTPTGIAGRDDDASLLDACRSGTCTAGCDPRVAGSCGTEMVCRDLSGTGVAGVCERP